MIADLRLRGSEHGAATAQRLRRTYGAFPVIIITGGTTSDSLREANQWGFIVLQKPIATERLREAIHGLLVPANAPN